MGNTHTTNTVQNGAIDSNVSNKIKGSRKNTNVKDKVLARFTSKKSLLKDINLTKCENLCENLQQKQQQQHEIFNVCQKVVPQKRNGTFEQSAVIESADTKRFSQISQGADSAKDALDCGEYIYIYLKNSNFLFVVIIFLCIFFFGA